MSCKQYERLIIETKERELSSAEQDSLTKHLAVCANCVSFGEQLQAMRSYLAESEQSIPTQKLLADTRSRCYQKLETFPVKKGLKLPRYVWALLAVLAIIAVVWLGSLLTDWQAAQIQFFINMSVIVFVVQNMVMLVLSPLLLSKHLKIVRVI